MNITVIERMEVGWQKFRIYHHGFYASVGTVGILSNIFLWRIIVKKTPEQISAYARVLKLCCIVNLIYAWSICLDHNILLIKDNVIFIVTNGFFKNFPLCFRIFLTLWRKLAHSLTLVMIPIPFIYRYFFICKNKILTNFELFKILLVCYIPCLTMIMVYGNSTLPVKKSVEIAEQVFKDFQWMNPQTDEIFVLYDITTADFKIAASTCLVVMIFLYGTIVVCGWKIFKKLKNSKKFSRTIGFQKQITRALTFQAFMPAVFIIGPMAIATIQASMEKDGIKLVLLFAAIMACYPIADPVITVIFVKPYYNAVFRRFTGRQNTTETIQKIEIS